MLPQSGQGRRWSWVYIPGRAETPAGDGEADCLEADRGGLLGDQERCRQVGGQRGEGW